jgi:hypothetical protein
VCAKGERGVEVEVLKDSVFENHRERLNFIHKKYVFANLV